MVAGTVCVDMVPSLSSATDTTPGALVELGPVEIRAGGCVANTGGDLADLGANVYLAGNVGQDDLGELLCRVIAKHECDTSGLVALPGTTTSCSIVVEPPATDRTIWHHVGANAKFDGAQLDLTSIDLLHIGYPTLLQRLTEDMGARLLDLLARARSLGITTSVDLAVVPPSSHSIRSTWAELLKVMLPLVDVFTPSTSDLASLGFQIRGSADGYKAVAEGLIEAGAGAVLLTAGAHGLLVKAAGERRLDQGGRVLSPLASKWREAEIWISQPRVTVVSTTGAGDAAAAGFIYALAHDYDPPRAAALAATAATLKVQGQRQLPRFGDGGSYEPLMAEVMSTSGIDHAIRPAPGPHDV